MRDYKLEITTKPIYFDLPKDAAINLRHEIYSTIKHNDLLAEHSLKHEIRQLLSENKHGYE